jgi:hypothetical protein
MFLMVVVVTIIIIIYVQELSPSTNSELHLILGLPYTFFLLVWNSTVVKN